MSIIAEKVAKLWPEGVSIRRLGDIAQISGRSVQPASMGTAPVVVYSLPSFDRDRVPEYTSGTEVGSAKTKLGGPAVLVAKLNPHIPRVWKLECIEDRAFCSPEFYPIEPDATILDLGFLYHFILSKMNFLAGTVTGSTNSHKRLRREDYLQLEISVPPLEAQREIVRELDQFAELETELETKLEAELIARRRQFEFYREREMSFDASVILAPLGEIVEVRSGWGFPNVHQGRPSGECPFYKVSDMNLLGNETVMRHANHYVSTEVAMQLGVRPAPAGTVIFPKIGAAVATNKKRVLSVPSAYDNNVMGLVPTERVNSRFLYHWMQNFDISRLANDSGAVPSIRKSEVERLLFPLPSLREQCRISDLLDGFDSLVNDLSAGLPAELSARRKQYEYYRDKLLTFDEAPS